MDYERKYKEALKKAKSIHSLLKDSDDGKNFSYAETIEDIFPELKETEDERIRKSLIGHLRECRNQCRSEVMIGEYAKWLAWLEKQGTKPSWSEEDIRNLQDIDSIMFYDRLLTEEVRTKLRNFLKSIKERVQPQPKQEWSEEDEDCVESAIAMLEDVATDELINWLKSLKERYTWKPSDEQIEALYTYIYNPQCFNSPDSRMELVESVYKDLKKLKEE